MTFCDRDAQTRFPESAGADLAGRTGSDHDYIELARAHIVSFRGSRGLMLVASG